MLDSFLKLVVKLASLVARHELQAVFIIAKLPVMKSGHHLPIIHVFGDYTVEQNLENTETV